MNPDILLTVIAFVFFRETSAFINGFPKEQCDDMDPTKIKLESSHAAKISPDSENATDFVEDAPPTSVQLSDSLNLYRLVTSATKYRRGRTLDITIRGPDFNAIMLEVRKIGADERRGHDKVVRVGEFVNWPPSLQPVRCDKDQLVTAVTNRNYQPKGGITLKWKAPKEDEGDIHIVARFVSGDEYWPLTESREIPISEFPVNLKSCGKAKSCILFSEGSPSCHEDNCDYILTYSVVNNTNVEFVLGGTAKGDQSYLAVGFSTTPEAEEMKLIACTRAKTVAEIKYFVGNSEALTEYPMHLENKKIDLDGNRMWCSFVAPMVTHSEDHGLDLSIPLYQIYARGNTNYTKSSNYPILPSKLLISKKEIQVEKIKLQYHTMEKSMDKSDSAMHTATLCTLVISATVIHFFQKKFVK